MKEPRIPAACATLPARLSAPGGVLSDAAESTPDTRRIQEAIDGCAAAGGGADAGVPAPGARAVVLRTDGDKNVFLAAPLQLRAGVTLVVDAGVALFASRNPRDYDVTPGSCGVVADKRGHCLPLIAADKAPGAGIMGDGAIDGRGGALLRGQKQTWWDLARDAKVRDQFQSCPRLINIRESNDFTLYRITLRNAANLHVGVERTDGFTAWAVKIKTPRTARNTDGIDPISSSNITITHCWIDTGDDNVAIKAGIAGAGQPRHHRAQPLLRRARHVDRQRDGRRRQRHQGRRPHARRHRPRAAHQVRSQPRRPACKASPTRTSACATSATRS